MNLSTINTETNVGQCTCDLLLNNSDYRLEWTL